MMINVRITVSYECEACDGKRSDLALGSPARAAAIAGGEEPLICSECAGSGRRQKEIWQRSDMRKTRPAET